MSPRHSFKQQKSPSGLQRKEKRKTRKRREGEKKRRERRQRGAESGRCDVHTHTSYVQNMHIIIITKKRQKDRQKGIRRHGLPVITTGGAAPSRGPQLALPLGALNSLRHQVLKALISENKPRLCNYMRRWIFINYCGNDFMTYVSLHTLNSLSAAYKSNLDKTERKKKFNENLQKA